MIGSFFIDWADKDQAQFAIILLELDNLNQISDDFGKDRMKEGMLLFRIASKIDPRIEPIPISSRAYKQDGWIPLLHEIKSTGIEITL